MTPTGTAPPTTDAAQAGVVYQSLVDATARTPQAHDPAAAAALQPILAAFIKGIATDGVYPVGGCLQASTLLLHHLSDLGYRACFQAGSASYRRVSEAAVAADPALTDVAMFSYLFGFVDGDGPSLVPGASYDYNPALNALARREMPELHCWIALPDLGLIIDPAAPLIPRHAKQTQGLDWEFRVPAVMLSVEYLTANRRDVIYTPDLAAILALPVYFLDEVTRPDTRDGWIAQNAAGYARVWAAALHLWRAVGLPPAGMGAKDIAPGGYLRRKIDALKAHEIAALTAAVTAAQPEDLG